MLHFKSEEMDFPSGPVIESRLVNAGDTGSIPGLKPLQPRTHTLQQVEPWQTWASQWRAASSRPS